MVAPFVTLSLNSLGLLRLLIKKKVRLFSAAEVAALLAQENLQINSLKNSLHYLKKKEWIVLLRKNLYALNDIFLEREPIHEFEIATKLVTPSALSHFTAFHLHELTDQLPVKTFITVPAHATLPQEIEEGVFLLQNMQYKFIQVKKEHLFGFDFFWRGNVKIPVTDLERTLLDGLSKPKYCGGIREVIHAFSLRKFDVEKIIGYALRLDKSVAKRLGWVLEKNGYPINLLKKLEEVERKGVILLDPSGPKRGAYNQRWHMRENA